MAQYATPSFWQLLQGLLGPTAPPAVPRGDIVLPSEREPAPEPPLGWLAPYLEGGTELIRGAVGLGDQGPAGPTWMNAGALLSALPLTSLPSLGRGLFSRVDDVLRQIPAKGIHPNKIASLLRSGATAEEAAYRGIPEFLASKGNAMVTPGELQAHLAAHPAPMPVVKTLAITPQDEFVKAIQLEFGVPVPSTPQGWTSLAERFERGAQQWQRNGVPDRAERLFQLSEQATEMAEGLDLGRGLSAGQPKYAKYQLPGGEAYRETLLTLPGAKEPANVKLQTDFTRANEELNAFRRTNPDAELEGLANPEYRRLVLARNRLGEQLTASENAYVAQQFRSGHFDEPNVVVHTRQNERVLPTGERGRFLEEIQSDWHQKGKEHGYQPREGMQEFTAFYTTAGGKRVPLAFGESREAALANVDRGWSRMPGITIEVEGRPTTTYSGPKPPDAPFKDLWPDLALKQQLLDTAQDPKLSWLGVTGGKTQAARYDLSKQISEIAVKPVRMAGDRKGVTSGWRLTAKGHGDQGNVITEDLSDLSKLSDFIGKDAAKAAAAQIDANGAATLTGLDLQVGGEGMQYFYDKLVPSRLEKLVKPFGGKVEPMTVPGTTDQGWMVRLTPEMKARMLKEGLPLLTVPLAVLGAHAGASEKR